MGICIWSHNGNEEGEHSLSATYSSGIRILRTLNFHDEAQELMDEAATRVEGRALLDALMARPAKVALNLPEDGILVGLTEEEYYASRRDALLLIAGEAVKMGATVYLS